jgi:hypothetical protein
LTARLVRWNRARRLQVESKGGDQGEFGQQSTCRMQSHCGPASGKVRSRCRRCRLRSRAPAWLRRSGRTKRSNTLRNRWSKGGDQGECGQQSTCRMQSRLRRHTGVAPQPSHRHRGVTASLFSRKVVLHRRDSRSRPALTIQRLFRPGPRAYRPRGKPRLSCQSLDSRVKFSVPPWLRGEWESPNFSVFALWRWNEMPLGAFRRCRPILS